MPQIEIPSPSLLFLADVSEATSAKTALGLKDWAPERCCGQWRLAPNTVDIGLSDLTPEDAVKLGARSLLIGIANPGGVIQENWAPAIVEAIRAGLHVVSGMHTPLDTIPEIRAAAERHKRRIIELRRFDAALPIGNGVRRPGNRLLTVGTDANLGKKYTALAIAKELQQRGVRATFRATGQTGILIAGSGIPLDAVVSDFISGAAEQLSPANDERHWDVIEGQGSIVHPGYAGVTLGLLHGSQPDALVLCHDPSRTHILRYDHLQIPPLAQIIELYLSNGRVTNPNIKFVGISLNTSKMTATSRQQCIDSMEREFSLPVVDPMATGVGALVDNIV